jgi:uncharacterized repeat protein (TIGR01451 family)
MRRCSALIVLWGLLLASLGGGSVFATVLTTITVDGNMADWAAVLADPWQKADDGPAGGLTDLDAPVQSTGRDLLAFAWTYDTTYVYFYAARQASSSNKQQFWFYLDTNENGLMQTGEPVIGVSWFGSTRLTEVTLYRYTAAAGGGDPLVSPAGLADGWDMAGTVTAVRLLQSVNGGAANGLAMESRVAWADLGVAPSTPLLFHVAAANSPNIPAQLDDNMGGPGGAVGSTRLLGVRVDPDRAGTAVPSGISVLAHAVTLTGANGDRIDLTATSSGAFTPSSIVFRRDADNDGQLDATDPGLTDTNGDGIPDTGLLAAGTTLPILVVATVPPSASLGQVATLIVTGRSVVQPSVFDIATDTITISTPRITLLKSVSATSAKPGDVLTYSVLYSSSGSIPAQTVVLVDQVPPPTAYRTGSAAGPGTLIEFSHDGGLSWSSSDAAPVTHVRWTLSAPLPPGASGSVSFQAVIP